MSENQTPPEISSIAQPRIPKELKSLTFAELNAQKDKGSALFAASEFGTLLSKAEKQIDSKEEELHKKLTETTPAVLKSVGEVRKKKQEAQAKESAASKTSKEAKSRKARLEKSRPGIAIIEGSTPDTAKGKLSSQEKAIQTLKQNLDFSLSEAAQQKETADSELVAAKKERKQADYRRAIQLELSKIPGSIEANSALGDWKKASELIDQTEEEQVWFQSGLIATAEKIKLQAQENKPIRELALVEAKKLDAIQLAADNSAVRLARKIDKTVESKVLGRDGRFTAAVEGAQSRREAEIAANAQKHLSEIKAQLVEKQYSLEAIQRAGDQVRIIVEKPGFFKKPMSDEYLKRDNLQVFEESQNESLLDKFRKKAFNAVNRTTVEDVLGCQLTVEGKGSERNINFELLSAENSEGNTPLFEKLVECEAVETTLREKLQSVDSTDIAAVRSLAEALRINEALRQSSIKLADSRINDILFTDGVRSGAIKTKLGDLGVRAGETVVVTGAIAGITFLVGDHFIDGSRDALISASQHAAQVLEDASQAPEKIAQIWAQMSGVTIEQAKVAISQINLDEISRAIGNQAVETVKVGADQVAQDASDLADKLELLARQAKNIEKLTTLIQTAGQQVETINAQGQAEAQRLESYARVSTSLGVAAGIIAIGTTMSEYGRRMISKPFQGLSKLANRFRGKSEESED